MNQERILYVSFNRLSSFWKSLCSTFGQPNDGQNDGKLRQFVMDPETAPKNDSISEVTTMAKVSSHYGDNIGSRLQVAFYTRSNLMDLTKGKLQGNGSTLSVFMYGDFL
jgi:hypothetical protein